MSIFGKIGKGWLSAGTTAIPGADSFLFGKSGEDSTYIDPRLDKMNTDAALTSANIRNQDLFNIQNEVQPRINTQLGGLSGEFDALTGELKNLPDQAQIGLNAQNLVGNQIEQQRRALALSGQNSQNALSMNIARRGLGNSAAGLFAQANADTAMNNNLANLEGSRVGSIYNMTNSMQDRNNMLRNQNYQQRTGILGMQGSLTNQLNSRLSGIQMPSTEYRNPAREGTTGFFKGIAKGVGSVVGGMFGGPTGAAAGKETGGALGDSSSNNNNTKAIYGKKETMGGSGYGNGYQNPYGYA